jgi:cysteinyl-tRNA synthetase
MYQSRYESPLNYSEELLEQSTNSLTKVLQQINQSYIQMFFNNYQIQPIDAQLHIEFTDALSDDLDFPKALTIIYEQAKGLISLIKPKTFDRLTQHLSILLKELDTLGIRYTNPLEDEVLKSIIIE